MNNRSVSKNKLFVLSIVFLFILCCFNVLNVSAGTNISGIGSCPSYKPVIPLKKTTFVGFDDESYLDDYAYLAAVPTTVFKESGVLFSNPLLFYQDERYSEDPVLDSSEGLNYFMTDWQESCDGEFDKIVAINTDEKDIKRWVADQYTFIDSTDPCTIANEIALSEWSYSDDAVIAVIDDIGHEREKETISGTIDGIFTAKDIKYLDTIRIDRTNYLKPQFEEFNIPQGYGYIKADLWWDAIFMSKAGMFSAADPSGDPLVQLYYNKNNEWIQSESSSDFGFGPLGHKYTHSYVYKPGSWKVGIVDLPTEKLKTQGQPLKALFSKTLTYNIDLSLYPCIETIEIPEKPRSECKNAQFELEWQSSDAALGFSIIGPAGEVIYTAACDEGQTSKIISLDSLGECPPETSYYISIFSMNDVKEPVNFQIKYSWDKYDSVSFLDSITSATEGAILASTLNSPLIYTSQDDLSKETSDVLYKLGIENIYLVNIGNHLSDSTFNKIKEIAKIKSEYKTVEQIYKYIQSKTDQNDVIFTTTNPWSYWNHETLKVDGEKKGALFIGPAAYIAAHHGSAPIILENHPKLSSSAVYHNEFWKHFSDDREHRYPSSSEMISTGEKIYEALQELGFDREGKETIITVADQFDIGVSWDRIFPGVANSGRFCGSPVDIAYSISRNMFYPSLVFQNPALTGLIELENGSVSKRDTSVKRASLLGFLSTKQSLVEINMNNYEKVRKEEMQEFEFPVLCSFVSYQHRFNERASKYYDEKYVGADGLIPGFYATGENIDPTEMDKTSGEAINIYPDMDESSIVPFYLRKGGYSCAFSTNMDSVVENLNKGVILWVHSSHGSTMNGGSSLFWNPEKGFEERNFYSAKIALGHKKILDLRNTLIGSLLVRLSFNLRKVFDSLEPTASVFEEKNPWRGYEWYYGSTEEPDTMSADIAGTLPYTGIKTPLSFPSLDWVLSYKPVKTVLNKITPFFDPFDVENLKDGVVGSIAHSKFQYYRYSSAEIEENLGNLHSAGFVTTMCDTANTYLHLMLIRHGTVFQIQNPWGTSQYGAVWQQSIPRDIVLGDTVGEAYTKGLSHVGNLYLGGKNGDTSESQLWWDTSQSTIYFGDPDLRVFVPGTNYSNDNYWQKEEVGPVGSESSFDLKGHSPFGATNYPNEKQPISFLENYLIVFIAIISIVIVSLVYLLKRREKNEK